MSAERAEGVARPIDAELSDALIAHCNLSGQDIDRITEAMRARRQSFCEAAFQLNLATREDIDDVSHWVREHTHKSPPGVIEAAIRSAQGGGGTALTVRQGIARLSSVLLHARDADSARSEKIRALRTDLMLLNDSAQRGNLVALVSPGRGEGRSQLCAELAIAFAQLGRRTLLVDADLRHPRQHVLFTADNQWGLAQTLALGEAPYLHGVEGLPELAVLTSGTIAPNPLELVSHRRFERLITEINTSIMVVRASLLGPALRRVGRQNAKNEYYLTDLIAVLHEAGHVTQALLYLSAAAGSSGVYGMR